MSNQRERQFSARTSSFGTILRLLGNLALIAVAIGLVVSTWDDARAATGEVPMRIFLVGYVVVAIIVFAGFPFTLLVSRRGQTAAHSVLPVAVYHVAIGVVIGLAVGTTDWTSLQLAGWWQFWWTVPLLLLYASLLTTWRRTLGSRP